MFTVKAEVWNGSGMQPFKLFQAAKVEVYQSTEDGCNGPGMPPYVKPELNVHLLDADGKCLDIVKIGEGQEHHSVVYVMNERGKTVEVIQTSRIPKIAA